MGARGMLRTGEGGRLIFHCPGCDGRHVVGPGWEHTGGWDRPTLRPSVLVVGVQPLTELEELAVMRGQRVERRQHVCHLFVSRGYLHYLPDCTHALVGQTVPMEAPWLDDGFLADEDQP